MHEKAMLIMNMLSNKIPIGLCAKSLFLTSLIHMNKNKGKTSNIIAPMYNIKNSLST
jgi:hypothetical protein